MEEGNIAQHLGALQATKVARFQQFLRSFSADFDLWHPRLEAASFSLVGSLFRYTYEILFVVRTDLAQFG
jgi:hypothetical protein